MEKIFLNEKIKCNGCSACAAVCPKNCITMLPDELGFLYPQIDENLCIDCGLCEKNCPVFNKSEIETLPKAYAVKNIDEKVRMQSSSGGAFTAVAEKILADGGVVFGAAFTADFKAVHHIAVYNSEDLQKLRGSKYVQSRIGNSFTMAKEELKKGKKVLFTGTPCQIGGFLSFLQKDYHNLYTQDIICHGVPSPSVWEKYVELREKEAGAGTSSVSFRYKNTGWATYSVQMKFQNCAEYCVINPDDPYMKGFLDNIYLRSSCYDCAFKTIRRRADITLADFWGVWGVLPEMYDDRGTSLVIANSEKGMSLINSIENQIKIVETDIIEAVKLNYAAEKSVPNNPRREQFISDFQNQPFEKTLKKYCSPYWKSHLKLRIKRILKI